MKKEVQKLIKKQCNVVLDVAQHVGHSTISPLIEDKIDDVEAFTERDCRLVDIGIALRAVDSMLDAIEEHDLYYDKHWEVVQVAIDNLGYAVDCLWHVINNERSK